jgi:ribosomal-protein-alanine N-acetyltransferase
MQLKDALTPIGTLGYHALNQHAMTIDIGYDLNPNYWGHGYMREALSFLIDHMRHTFKGYHIHACIYKDNIKSIAAVKHFGFTFEKDYDEIFRGKPYKHHIYRLDASKKVML